MKFHRLAALALAAILAALGPVLPATAQTYPARTITIVVPLAAGTAMDSLARFFAEELQKAFGQPVIVSNQPGASFMLAAQAVAKAEPDGYTLLVNSAPAFAVNPTLFKKINYDPETDFVPIAIYAKSPFLLLVNSRLGIGTTKAFIEKALASAVPLNYASPGAGTLQFLAMETLKQQFTFKLEHVPYRASPQILSDLLGEHINASIHEAGGAVPLVREGKITALATTSLVRHHALPDVPTLAEAAGLPGFEVVSWHAILAPAATPGPVVTRLTAEVQRIAATDTFKKRVLELGLEPQISRTTDETKAYMRSERERWGGVVRSLGLEGSQ
jgi:tripartite-type tricarboxylate transporter receptor subunit TctC